MDIPQPASNPDTPSEMPGTPTSTTTSLSTLSTTALKDGHRGQPHLSPSHRGHHHQASTNSLEAERADRISRLTGLSSLSGLRVSAPAPGPQNDHSPQTTPTSSGFPAHAAAQAAAGGLTPAYFDAAGQPVAATKRSTVGSASATESIVGGTTSTDMTVGDEDMLSTDTNFRETEADSASGYMGGGPGADIDPMDEDLASRSVGGFEDRMSDDGNASLVGFGEGAGSTVSGPIYHRRPPPPPSSGQGGRGSPGPFAGVWGLERSSSGLSDTAPGSGGGGGGRRDTVRGLSTTHEVVADGGGDDTPVSASAAIERDNARMVDGVATDGAGIEALPAAEGAETAGQMGRATGPDDDDDDVYVDTTTRGPIPVRPGAGSNNRESHRQQQQHPPPPPPPHHHQQNPYQREAPSPSSREELERFVRERLDSGESRAVGSTLGAPTGETRLGGFYFEERK